jgi:hypothetical protein
MLILGLTLAGIGGKRKFSNCFFQDNPQIASQNFLQVVPALVDPMVGNPVLRPAEF